MAPLSPAQPSLSERLTAALLWLAVGLPLAWLVGLSVASALRALLHLPMLACAAGGGLVALLAWLGAAWRGRQRAAIPVPAGAGVLVLGGWLLLRQWQTLYLTAPYGLVTVGGGDFGNHLAMANQMAQELPGIYAGCTSWHVGLWTLVQAGLPWPWPATLMTHASMASASLFAATFAVLVPWQAAQSRRSQWAATVTAMGLTALLWERFLLPVYHYNQADGFVAHLHAIAPLFVTALAAAMPGPLLLRFALLTLGTLLGRFAYGINLPDQALAWSLVAWRLQHDSETAALVPSRWRAHLPLVWRTLAYLGWGFTVLAGLMLARSWAKPGGVVHPTILVRIATLAVGMIGAVALWRQRQPVLQRLGRWLLVVVGVPFVLAVLHGVVVALARHYYVWKHGTLGVLMGLLALVAAAGAAMAVAVEDGRRWRAWLVAGSLVVVAAVSTQLARRGNPGLVGGYLDRQKPATAWQEVSPLWDNNTFAAATTLRSQGKEVVALMHPKWPVASVLASALEFGTPQPPILPQDLQPKRWVAFLDGTLPEPGQCVVFAAAPHRLVEWRRTQNEFSGWAWAKIERWLAADPAVQCQDDPPLAPGWPAERTCWRCL